MIDSHRETSATAPPTSSRLSGNADFAFVLVNYKTPEITPICLSLLRDYASRSGADIWVVDNASNDASIDYLRRQDWIRLIERQPPAGESGTMGHARALDLVLTQAKTRYLFLLHTDTFVYDCAIFDLMLQRCRAEPKLAAIGCLDQIDRGHLRRAWRLSTRYLKHHSRRVRLALGMRARHPQPYRETYLKSFCALWDIELLRQQGLSFSAGGRTPGNEIQDRLTPLGFRFLALSETTVFRYLDHIEAGTVAETGGYGPKHRRWRKYQQLLAKARQKLEDKA